MKKIKYLLLVLILIVITGCTDMVSSPTKRVESFLSKYQKLDDEVLSQLDIMLDKDANYSSENKEEYKALLIKQYQNLSYKITDERVEDGSAEVDVEIEVYDYKDAIEKAKEYYRTHKEELKDKTLVDYQISKMKDVTEKSTYTITFYLTKDADNNWTLENITDEDRQKIHGIY